MSVIRRVLLVLACLSSLFHGAFAENPDKVGDLGDLSRLEIKGSKTFRAEAIRSALQWDMDVLTSAQPAAPLHEYLAAIRHKVTEGYRDAGFPETKIAVAADRKAGRVTVAIDEGKRYLAGEVRVEGARRIPPARLIEAVTGGDPPAGAIRKEAHPAHGKPMVEWVDKEGMRVELDDASWRPGSPAPFDEPTQQTLPQATEAGDGRRGVPRREIRFGRCPAAGPRRGPPGGEDRR